MTVALIRPIEKSLITLRDYLPGAFVSNATFQAIGAVLLGVVIWKGRDERILG